jgi:hypothetical protein
MARRRPTSPDDMSASVTPLRPVRTPARARFVWPYVLVLLALAGAAVAATGVAAIAAAPVLFGALVAMVAVLDRVEGSLPAGGDYSPTGVPALALALVFGPAGAVGAELALSVHRATRAPLQRVLFNVGGLGLAGIAAWVVAGPLPDAGPAVLVTGLAVGVAYYAVNTVLLLGAWTLSEGRPGLAMWRERLSASAVHEIACGPVAALLVLAERELGLLALALVAAPVLALWAGQRHSLQLQARNVAELQAANRRLRRVMATTVESLARTIEARDPYTGGHTERVGEFAEAIARRLGLGEEEVAAIALGAVIHDIGKIGIPDAVLLKAGPLDPAEWQEMRRHPEIGAYILGELELPAAAKAMARHHHERFDGGGYPDGLAGDAIPLAARILSVADALDAMTSDRPYRPALALHAALAELRAQAGTQFCPAVVAAALDVVAEPLAA